MTLLKKSLKSLFAPRHLIIVDGSIMQAIPEHPKRDFIFCLSTAFGDAYLFQVSVLVQGQLEIWTEHSTRSLKI